MRSALPTACPCEGNDILRIKQRQSHPNDNVRNWFMLGESFGCRVSQARDDRRFLCYNF
jgi:hypothetical protein